MWKLPWDALARLMHTIQGLQPRIALAVDIVLGVIAVPLNSSKHREHVGPRPRDGLCKPSDASLLLRDYLWVCKISFQASKTGKLAVS